MTFLIIYIVSLIGMYAWMHIAYSERGVSSDEKADIGDVIFTLCPILNTILFFVGWFFMFPLRNWFFNWKEFIDNTPNIKEMNFNGFFGVKK